jgi:CO dehydrogenase maturation factor
MSCRIAVCGKGGVGKTTVAALMVLRLITRNRTPVLALDADPNSCLNSSLGVGLKKTVGGIREEARVISGAAAAPGIAKQRLLEMKIAECLVEAENFDLIAMGRSEGPGCYCYANNVLKAVLEKLSAQYPYIVLDNEAGLENLSRRIVQKVETLVLVTDPSVQGAETVRRIHGLALEMQLQFDRLVLAVNRMRTPSVPEHFRELQERTGAKTLMTIPENAAVLERAEQGRSLAGLAEDDPAVRAIDGLLDELNL